MPYERHPLAGFTDYTGVSLEDICQHLQESGKLTKDTISQLEKYHAATESNAELLENYQEVISYLNFFIDLFSRYLFDIQRLLQQFPSGVTEAHVEIVRQLYRSSKNKDSVAIQFKKDWIHKSLAHEEMRPLLESIYCDTRDVLIDYSDFSNLAPRLITFIDGHRAPTEILPDLHLKPNFFGIGVNLNRVLARVHNWWRARLNKTSNTQ
jgi:hypothetical protein